MVTYYARGRFCWTVGDFCEEVYYESDSADEVSKMIDTWYRSHSGWRVDVKPVVRIKEIIKPPTIDDVKYTYTPEVLSIEVTISSHSSIVRDGFLGFSIGNFASGKWYDHPLQILTLEPEAAGKQVFKLEMKRPVDITATDFWVTIKSGADAPFDDERRFEGVLPPAAPPEEYKILPTPPATFPAVFIPTYKLLDDAVFRKDKAEVLRILKEHAWDEASPIAFMTAVALVVGALSLIVAVVGSYPFAAFLFEETLQTIDMAAYEARQDKQWDIYGQVLAKKKEFLDSGMFDTLISLIPVVNVIAAVKKYTEASKFKLDIDNKLLERKISRGVTPSPGDFTGYVSALDAGLSPYKYLPKATAILRINVNAPGGTVEINELGWSSLFPFEIELAAGTYTVKVGAEGKQTLAKSVTLEPYEDKIVEFFLSSVPVPPVEEKGTINISSTPTGAKIYLDFEYLFELTNTTVKVSPGTHTITLKKADYNDQSKTVAVRAGETINVSMALEPVVAPPTPPTPPEEEVPEKEVVIPLEPGAVPYNAWKVTVRGVDSITGAELAAWILINDIFMNRSTPYYFYLLPEAIYNIKLRLKGYRQGEVTFTTEPLPEV